jgi:hypothetical protein
MTTLSIITEDNEVTYTNYTGSGPLAFTFPYFQKEDLNVDVDGVTISPERLGRHAEPGRWRQ